jgi:hypothetical protein
MAKASQEKRELERVSFLSECLVESQALGGVKTARINDLHTGGAFIDVVTPFPIGSVLQLRFRLRDNEINVKAEVRYSMANIGVGVRFLDLSDEGRDLIENVLFGKPIRPKVIPFAKPDQRPNAGTAPLTSEAGTVPRPNTVLSGNLSLLSVFDVINMIQNSRLTGYLAISAPANAGTIYFNEGHIVDADRGNDRGVAALNWLVGATSGNFVFNRSDKPFETTIPSTNNTALLLDMMVTREKAAHQSGALAN